MTLAIRRLRTIAILAALTVLLGVGCGRGGEDALPIDSPEKAAFTIDRLADALEAGDSDAAMRLMARKHGDTSSIPVLAQARDQAMVRWLRSRRYHSKSTNYFVFEIASPDGVYTRWLRVYFHNADEAGIYDDEGIELP